MASRNTAGRRPTLSVSISVSGNSSVSVHIENSERSDRPSDAEKRPLALDSKSKSNDDADDAEEHEPCCPPPGHDKLCDAVSEPSTEHAPTPQPSPSPSLRAQPLELDERTASPARLSPPPPSDVDMLEAPLSLSSDTPRVFAFCLLQAPRAAGTVDIDRRVLVHVVGLARHNYSVWRDNVLGVSRRCGLGRALGLHHADDRTCRRAYSTTTDADHSEANTEALQVLLVTTWVFRKTACRDAAHGRLNKNYRTAALLFWDLRRFFADDTLLVAD